MTYSCPFLARCMGWRVGNLVHAIVVEKDERTARRSENRIPGAPQYCPRVITLDALPAVQFNRKWLEWPARRQRVKDFLEMLCGHFCTFPFFSTLRLPVSGAGLWCLARRSLTVNLARRDRKSTRLNSSHVAL